MTAAVRADTDQHLAIVPIPLHVLAPLLVYIGESYQDGLGVLFEDLARAWELVDGPDWKRAKDGISYDTAVYRYERALSGLTTDLTKNGVAVAWGIPAAEARVRGAELKRAGRLADGYSECAGGCGAWVHWTRATENGCCNNDCDINMQERAGAR